jgi:hypothetical protein
MFAGCETPADTPSDVSSHLAGRILDALHTCWAVLATANTLGAFTRPYIDLVRYASGSPCSILNGRSTASWRGERIAATTAISQYVDAVVRQSFPGADVEAMSTAGVSFAAWPYCTSTASSMRPPLRLCRLGCAPRSAHCSQLLAPRRWSEPMNRRRALA